LFVSIRTRKKKERERKKMYFNSISDAYPNHSQGLVVTKDNTLNAETIVFHLKKAKIYFHYASWLHFLVQTFLRLISSELRQEDMAWRSNENNSKPAKRRSSLLPSIPFTSVVRYRCTWPNYFPSLYPLGKRFQCNFLHVCMCVCVIHVSLV